MLTVQRRRFIIDFTLTNIHHAAWLLLPINHQTSLLVSLSFISFKKGLIDLSGRLSSCVGEDCCQWRGIDCNNISGHVTKLDLRNQFESNTLNSTYDGDFWINSLLGGEISSSSIYLKFLFYLDLSWNDFEGIRIPEFLCMIENLMYLNLSSSLFYGEIPPHLGNLSSLMHLGLHGNFNMHAKNLGWLSSLSSLKFLDMGGVNLSGARADWLHAVNMLSSLMELHLSRCGIKSLPSLPFYNFTSLFVLDLSYNNFSSSIPHWLFNLNSLTKLHFSFIYFQITIPYDFVN